MKERALWLEKIKVLMEDEVLRKELGGKGHQIIARMDIEKSFEVFWKEHVQQSGGR